MLDCVGHLFERYQHPSTLRPGSERETNIRCRSSYMHNHGPNLDMRLGDADGSLRQFADLINIFIRDDSNVRITPPHDEDTIFVLVLD